MSEANSDSISNLLSQKSQQSFEEEQALSPRSTLSQSNNRTEENSYNNQEMSDDDDIPIVNIDNFSGPFLVWAEDKSVQQEIKRIFRRFLKTFEDANENAVYAKAVRKMCRENRASLEVDYNHIGQSIQNIAIWLADYPERILVMLDAALQDVVEEAFPGYSRIQNTVHVRIMNLPIEDKLRELRHMHLGRLIRCFGVATKRTSVIPQLVTVRFNCVKCNYLTFPFAFLGDEKMGSPDRCGECGSKGPFRVNTKETIYRNYQRITLQESPGSVPAGRVPRRKEVILSNDLIDSVRPGEEIGVTGIYRNRFEMTLNTRVGFPVFKTEIEANHVQKTKQQFIENLTEEDKEQIRNFAKKQNIYEIIINSIAPSIHGHRFVKEALAMALFGGTAKEVDKSRHRLRGDINILILGDPGTAKSQFLKYLEKSAPRAVYSTGKGASGVGLTASVQRDAKTREWTLEGGALVLADQGMCLIDEFDKMNDHDRTSIHEAMEQQTISISKAGIVTTLQARCSVVAVANPSKERYDSSATFAENIELSDTLISRFDIICVVKDTVDPIEDERLANFVMKSHVDNHPDKKEEEQESQKSSQSENKETIPQDLLKKYISYARNSVRPKIVNIDQHKVMAVYKKLRQESMRDGAIPIGVRHIESIIRMSEARAKMHLRNYVSNKDVDVAVGLAINSFVETQKFSVMRSMRRKFRQFLHSVADYNELLFHVLTELFRDEQNFRSFVAQREVETAHEGNGASETVHSLEVTMAEFEGKARQLEIFSFGEFYGSERFRSTFELDKKAKLIRKID